MKRRLIAATAALLLTGEAARASAFLDESFRITRPDGRHELSLGLGAFSPTAKMDINGVAAAKGQRFGRLGYAFDFDYFYNPLSFFSVGIGGMLLNRTGYETRGLIANAESRIRGESSLGLLLVRLRSPSGRLRPYAIGGFGVHHTRMDMVASPYPGYALPSGARDEQPLVRSNATGPAGTARVGVEWGFSEGGVLALEGGYVRVQSSSYQATDLGKQNGVTDVVTSGDGLVFSLRLGVRMGAGGRGP